ncbi:hypothetical protein ALC62_03815 [Cyphomyrmex costatus]|uniref:Uncharacterized protein n=1 Tax=Cyphomyrmex costatus TaxID=456900 RepID=A0A151ILC9_9HYME|nr:hypothetical protein ALC62_03815 [Cyphomyrmex costatus]
MQLTISTKIAMDLATVQIASVDMPRSPCYKFGDAQRRRPNKNLFAEYNDNAAFLEKNGIIKIYVLVEILGLRSPPANPSVDSVLHGGCVAHVDIPKEDRVGPNVNAYPRIARSASRRTSWATNVRGVHNK